ncbi:MAG: hypothetical protein ACXADY_04045 [Candidatus Hodarchaeales archaeon]|jgi:predicted transcriptional regulator
MIVTLTGKARYDFIQMRRKEGYKQKEIAKELGLTLKGLKNFLWRNKDKYANIGNNNITDNGYAVPPQTTIDNIIIAEEPKNPKIELEKFVNSIKNQVNEDYIPAILEARCKLYPSGIPPIPQFFWDGEQQGLIKIISGSGIDRGVIDPFSVWNPNNYDWFKVIGNTNGITVGELEEKLIVLCWSSNMALNDQGVYNYILRALDEELIIIDESTDLFYANMEKSEIRIMLEKRRKEA